jgi:hypothetical protein
LNVTIRKPGLIGLAAAILLLLLFPSFWSDVEAQAPKNFTTSEHFDIPELNGSISFAINGSYSSAKLVNNSWVFENLRLNNLNSSLPLGNLTVSATNSNMTILLFRSYVLLGRTATLRYNVKAGGSQVINLGLNNSRPTHPDEWSINVAGRGFVSEGTGWNLLPKDTVVVSGLSGNISVSHFGYLIPDTSNLPFYQQHSIIITTGALIAAILVVALVIHFKVRG